MLGSRHPRAWPGRAVQFRQIESRGLRGSRVAVSQSRTLARQHTSRRASPKLQFLGPVLNALGGLHQGANPLRIRLPVAVARQGIRSAAGLDQDFGPQNAGLDMHRRHLGNADADFVLAEPGTFVADDGPVIDLNDGREQMVPARPAARFEEFRFHVPSLRHVRARATRFRPKSPVRHRPAGDGELPACAASGICPPAAGHHLAGNIPPRFRPTPMSLKMCPKDVYSVAMFR